MRSFERISKSEEKQYFAEARSWDEDKEESLRGSARKAWLIAYGSLGITALMAAVLVALVPLKEAVPYVTRVDSSTGIVDQLVRVKDLREDFTDEVMDKHFLVKYLTRRENYARSELQAAYDELMMFTAPSYRQEFTQDWDFSNPLSPYRRYGETGQAKVRVKTRALIAPNKGQIRYALQERINGNIVESDWIATIDFRYTLTPASETVRDTNPLGFQVTNFRRDPESEARR